MKALLPMVLAIHALLCACASGPPLPEIDFVEPPADRAYIWVYRTGLYRGLVGIWLDGVLAGDLGPDNFAFFQVRPGSHLLGSEAGNDLPVHVVGGEVVFLQQDVTLVLPACNRGLSTRTKMDGVCGTSELKVVSAAEGRKRVQQRSLIQEPPPPLPPATKPTAPSEPRLTGGPNRGEQAR
jgi:hypothetical protein